MGTLTNRLEKIEGARLNLHDAYITLLCLTDKAWPRTSRADMTLSHLRDAIALMTGETPEDVQNKAEHLTFPYRFPEMRQLADSDEYPT